MRAWRQVIVAGVCAGLAAGAAVRAQVVVDRILSRPAGEILTLSDVWRAIELRLVPLEAWTVEAARAALENRRLVLAEIGRVTLDEPTAADVASVRAAWEERFGGAPTEAQLAEAGMTEAQLSAWLRDDARIRRYLDERFAATPEADRPAAIEVWVGLLRQRAGLGGGTGP